MGRALGALAIRLVDREHVANLHEPGLERLHRIARLGHEHDQRRVRGLGHLELALPGADGLDQDAAEADRLERRTRRWSPRRVRRASRATPSSG
jgi:hypothetical protein